jgi:hypothetical protein
MKTILLQKIAQNINCLNFYLSFNKKSRYKIQPMKTIVKPIATHPI